MTAPTCSKCHDTGSLSRDVYDGTLDCTHCEVATERAAFNKWLRDDREFKYINHAHAWMIFLHGNATQAAQPEQPPIGFVSRGLIEHSLSWGFGASTYVQAGGATDEFPIAIYTAPASADELATALRGLHGWAIEMLDMAEFKAWPDADRADFMLKMRAAEELLKNYPRKA